MISSYTLLAPTDGSGYETLVRTLSGLCAFCTLAVRDFDRTNETVATFLKKIGKYEVNKVAVQAWPGTQLLGDSTADLHQYRISDDLITLLASEVPSIFSWATPNLPEDLCFYREDGSVMLGTISHERDCFLVISDSELASLQQKVPFLDVMPTSSEDGLSPC